jgi:hypothetical protein
MRTFFVRFCGDLLIFPVDFNFCFGMAFLGFMHLLQVILSVYFWEGNFDNSGGMTDIFVFYVWNRKILYLLNSNLHKTPQNPMQRLITTSASTTSTMHTLHNSSLCQFRFWNTTYTSRSEIRFFSLNAFQTTKLLVSLFLPSCY